MSIMLTTFMPCSAKLTVIALVSGTFFPNNSWVAPSAYFMGIVAVVCSGIFLKKTALFAGPPAPFVMELPAYHLPRDVARTGICAQGRNDYFSVMCFVVVFVEL